MFLFKRQFWFGVVAGLALGAVVRQRRYTGLTQERLDDYYRRRASFYNLTDYLYLGEFPRITMRKTIIEMADLKPGMRVLDYACGAGANFPYIMERIGPTGKLVATDWSQDMLDSAHQQFVVGRGWKNIELVQGDAAQMKFDEPFDVVMSTLGLAVIPGWEQAMQRAWEALKPGGIFAVADLRESTRWYTLPIRWLTDFIDVFIIADSTRRPWEWMEKQGVDYRYQEIFHGYFYAATVKKPLEKQA
jgi:ubiquinone/menaquinone biosynthesis C-methylase UbiE